MPSSSAANTLRFSAITAGYDHTCALTLVGAAYCWDGNGGALGDGTTSYRLVPTPVAGGLQFTDISAANGLTCALTPSGEAYCWDDNFYGELGIGTYTGREHCPTYCGGTYPCRSDAVSA